jgi:hypothetical protein
VLGLEVGKQHMLVTDKRMIVYSCGHAEVCALDDFQFALGAFADATCDSCNWRDGEPGSKWRLDNDK